MRDDYIEILNDLIGRDFKNALKLSFRNPGLFAFMAKTLRWQRRAVKMRTANEARGVHVPPLMIMSITNRCNLNCAGCYARKFHGFEEKEMSAQKFERIVSEAQQLGVSIIMLAGGEPLMRSDILEVAQRFPRIIFPVFTNGMLIDEAFVRNIRKRRNLMPVLSIEGHEQETDQRRGAGVYQRVAKAIPKLKNRGIFWGISITVNCQNFEKVTEEAFVQEILRSGCKMIFYVEYVPVAEGTLELTLTEDQKQQLSQLTNRFQDEYPGLFFALPGEEEKFGGCLAAGRGFVHINPAGNLEPCPFAPYSDTNLENISLEEALRSEFLKVIRQNHDKLTETRGGCALWENRAWVQSLLSVDAEVPA